MIESDSYLIVDRTGYEKGTFIKDIKKMVNPIKLTIRASTAALAPVNRMTSQTYKIF